MPYRADARGGDVAVLRGEFRAVVAHELEHGAQILHVEQEQAVLVGDLEDDIQHTGLHIGQPQQARNQHRPHVGYRDADGVPLLAEDIPEAGRVGLVLEALDAEALDAAAHIRGVRAGHTHTADVTLDVGHEHRHAHVGEGLSHHLHGYRFAGAGRAGDESVAVCHIGQQEKVLVRLRKPYLFIFVHASTPVYVFALFGQLES